MQLNPIQPAIDFVLGQNMLSGLTDKEIFKAVGVEPWAITLTLNELIGQGGVVKKDGQYFSRFPILTY